MATQDLSPGRPPWCCHEGPVLESLACPTQFAHPGRTQAKPTGWSPNRLGESRLKTTYWAKTSAVVQKGTLSGNPSKFGWTWQNGAGLLLERGSLLWHVATLLVFRSNQNWIRTKSLMKPRTFHRLSGLFDCWVLFLLLGFMFVIGLSCSYTTGLLGCCCFLLLGWGCCHFTGTEKN